MAVIKQERVSKKTEKTKRIYMASQWHPLLKKRVYGPSRANKKDAKQDDAKKLTQLIENKTNIKIENSCVLIDQAIKNDCNILIAPNGIVGNTIFRTLVLLNSWPSYGAITFGIDGIYIDTSRDRNTDGYLRSLELAYKLAKL